MPNEQHLDIPRVCEHVFIELYRLPKWLEREALDHFIEKNRETLSSKALLAAPKGMQYAGEHFHDSRKERHTLSGVYLPVAPQLLEEFRGLLQNRDYLLKQGKDAWMYLKICQQQAATFEDLFRLLPEGAHECVNNSGLLDVDEANELDETTDEKAEALKVQYAPYYEAILCRLADNLFLEAA